MFKTLKNNLKFDKDLFYLFLYVHSFPLIFIIFNNYVKNNINPFDDLEKTFIANFNFFIVFFILYLVLKKVFKNKYKLILNTFLIIILFLNAIDIFLYANFSVQLTPELLNIFFETNQNEAKEFLIAFFNIKLVLPLGYIIFGFLWIKSFTKFKFLKLTLLLFIFSLFSIKYLDISGNERIRKKHVIKNIYFSFSRYFKEANDLKIFLNNFEENTKHINVTSLDQNDATYIFIIGESFTKYHSSLYGYPRNTNPYMKSLAAKGELFTFTDVVSPHHFTRETLKKLVSTFSHDSETPFEQSMNIIDIMKKAGFKTYWISNQEDFAYRGAGLSAIAHRADSTKYTENNFIEDKHTKIYDEYILPLLEEAINDKTTNKKFIVIHLFGSHAVYEARYPKQFITFDIDSTADFFNQKQLKHKEIVNHYDNSLVYNDFIIKSIIENSKLHDKNSFILYLSDHGQAIYEDINEATSPIPTKTLRSVEIPLIFWSSDLYRKTHPEIFSNVKASLNNSVASEDIIYTLVDLCNLKYSQHNPEKSVINPLFKPKQRVISSEGHIYEKLKQK